VQNLVIENSWLHDMPALASACRAPKLYVHSEPHRLRRDTSRTQGTKCYFTWRDTNIVEPPTT